MFFYWLRLYPEQPLHLDDPAIIPARAIRGALAAITLRGCRPGDLHDLGPCGPECSFWPLFGGARTAIRFGSAYAATGDDVAPFPATARSCRNHPGFAASGGHGVLDVAIRSWMFEQARSDPARLLIPFEARCPVCGAPLGDCEGLLLRQGGRDYSTIGDLTLPVVTPNQSISRTTRRTANTFTQMGALLAGTAYYVARIDVPETLDTPLRRVLREGLMVGGRRTRGMGAVRAELVPRPDPTATLRDRIGMFNRAVRAESRFYAAMAGVPSPDEGEWYFTLDFSLQSTYARQPDPLADLKPLRSVTVIRQWLHSETVSGRNTATRLPISTALTFSGMALCRVPPEEDRAALERALAYLETNGGGLERVYSRLTVCDPFHLEVEPL